MEEKIYHIEKPDIEKYLKKLGNKSILSKDISQYLADLEVKEAISKTLHPHYLHWKDIKYKSWIPSDFKNRKEAFWALVKRSRLLWSRTTPIEDYAGNVFSWNYLKQYEELLHSITLDMSNYLFDISSKSSDYEKYQAQGIIEEAIASSQLEGAHTTRKAAKKMIEEKRDPKTSDERMIYNNYMTMKAIQEKFKNEKLSIEALLEMHRMLTDKSNLKESEQGNFRQKSEQIVIMKGDDPRVVSYVAPPIEFVKKEMKKLVEFANDELETKDFIHPVVKAIMLHFWIGLLHPFVDGNGRLARGLFYWYLLRKGYWAFAFLPISIVIKSAPAQYSEAYILSEQDDNDLTYFIDYHLKKIEQAIENFRKFFRQKSIESRKINKILNEHENLNRRQIETLTKLKQEIDKSITVTAYKNIHNVTKATAIKDLKILKNLGFMSAKKRGRNVFYTITIKAQNL